MMKKTLIGAIAVALAIIGTGCGSKVSLEAPTVTAKATNGGGTLHLTWYAISGAASYEIKAGDSLYTTTDTVYDVSYPSAAIQVRAVKGSSKGDSTVIDCKVVESTVEFYGDLNVNHPGAFGFNTNGTVFVCSLSYPSVKGADFYADSSRGWRLFSSRRVNTNRSGNMLKAASGSFDAAKLADPLGTYSDTSVAIVVDSAYYLRVSSDTTRTWSEIDHFAKASVVSFGDSAKVTLKLGYQKVDGLRWLAK